MMKNRNPKLKVLLSLTLVFLLAFGSTLAVFADEVAEEVQQQEEEQQQEEMVEENNEEAIEEDDDLNEEAEEQATEKEEQAEENTDEEQQGQNEEEQIATDELTQNSMNNLGKPEDLHPPECENSIKLEEGADKDFVKGDTGSVHIVDEELGINATFHYSIDGSGDSMNWWVVDDESAENLINIDVVYVKGGPGYKTHLYESYTTEGNGLTAQINPQNPNNKVYGISYFKFCYSVEERPVVDCIPVPLSAISFTQVNSFTREFENDYFKIVWINAGEVEITVKDGYCIGFHLSSYSYPEGTNVSPNGEPWEVQSLFDDDNHLFEGEETKTLKVDLPRDCEPVQVDLYTYRFIDGEWVASVVEIPPHHGPTFGNDRKLHSAHVRIPTEPCEETGSIHIRKVLAGSQENGIDEELFLSEAISNGFRCVGEGMEGIRFRLEKWNEDTEEWDVVIEESDPTDEFGYLDFDELEPGEYRVIELNAEAYVVSYTLDGSVIEEGTGFTVDGDNYSHRYLCVTNRLRENGDDPGDDPEDPGDDPGDDTPTTTITTGTGGGTPVTTTTVTVEEPEVPLTVPELVVPVRDETTEIILDEPIPLAPPVLPQTGERNPLTFTLAGLFLIAVGFIFRKRVMA